MDPADFLKLLSNEDWSEVPLSYAEDLIRHKSWLLPELKPIFWGTHLAIEPPSH